MVKKALLSILVSSLAYGTFNVGDTVDDFTLSVCANGTGNLSLYDYYGDLNGGEYHVIWINLFTSW